MDLLDVKNLNKKYVGKEVIYDNNKRAFICGLTSYSISLKTSDTGWSFEYESYAVTSGHIRLADEALQEDFVREYKEYVNSECGILEAFLYYSEKYD